MQIWKKKNLPGKMCLGLIASLIVASSVGNIAIVLASSAASQREITNGEYPLPGDADTNGVVNLDDAQLVLQSALGITELNKEIQEITDINQSGGIDLEDAKQTLLIALGIVTVESVLCKNPMYVAENCLSFELETDKEVYSCGETAQVKACVINNGMADVPLFQSSATFGKPGCIKCNLITENGDTIVYDEYFTGAAVDVAYTGVLASGEALEVSRSIKIPETLEMEENQGYYIELVFEYYDESAISIKTKTRKIQFPVSIVSVQ